MKKSFNIQWSETSLDKLNDEYYAQFFLLERNGKVVYIGNSFHRRISQLIPASIKAAELHESGTRIYLGRVREISKLSSELVENMQRIMVYARKPLFNVIGKMVYESKGNITLFHKGCDLLPEHIRANKWGVFLSRKTASSYSYSA